MKNKKVLIGWILIVLQAVAFFGMFSSGNTIARNQGAGLVLAEWLGFFVPAIIGIILLIKGYSSRSKTNSNVRNESKYTNNVDADPAKKYDPDQQYRFYWCPQCGTKLRVPAGVGKVQIVCTQCKSSFIAQSQPASPVNSEMDSAGSAAGNAGRTKRAKKMTGKRILSWLLFAVMVYGIPVLVREYGAEVINKTTKTLQTPSQTVARIFNKTEDNVKYSITLFARDDLVYQLIQTNEWEEPGINQDYITALNEYAESVREKIAEYSFVTYDMSINGSKVTERYQIRELDKLKNINAVKEIGILSMSGGGLLSLEKSTDQLLKNGWTE